MTGEHVIPRKMYYNIFVALMVLLALTIGVAFINLGTLNFIIAFTIAVIKATLVALYFMHVRYSSRLVWVFASGGLFWLAIMIMLTLSDYLTR